MKYRMICGILALTIAGWLPLRAQDAAPSATPSTSKTQCACCNKDAAAGATAEHDNGGMCAKQGKGMKCCNTKAKKGSVTMACCEGQNAAMCAGKDGKGCSGMKGSETCCGGQGNTNKDCCDGKDGCKHA